MTREALGNNIWRACDIMRRDDGTTGIMEYMEQLSWLLFLKAFEGLVPFDRPIWVDVRKSGRQPGHGAESKRA